MTREQPWAALMQAIGEERFAAIRGDLAARGTDGLDRDAFLLNGAVAQVLRDLVPEDAPAAAVTSYGALLHMLYCSWTRGWPVTAVDADALRRMLALPLSHSPTLPLVCYARLPELLVWAQPEPGAAHEPLHGVFVLARPGRLQVLALLGVREGREGFTTVEADTALPLPPPGPRADGSPAFASVIPGGERRHLTSLVSPLELATLAAAVMVEPGSGE